jgi:hypothetical protein
MSSNVEAEKAVGGLMRFTIEILWHGICRAVERVSGLTKCLFFPCFSELKTGRKAREKANQEAVDSSPCGLSTVSKRTPGWNKA